MQKLLESCEILKKSYAKINIFLKIVGKTEIKGVGYHLLHSRFMRFVTMYDILGFRFNAEAFDVVCDINCKQNIIYKAYRALLPHITSKAREGLAHLQVVVDKRIPSGAGLGGGSSNAACFLEVVNSALNLGLSKEALLQIGAEVGSDVPFFLSGLEIANVSGRGEQIASCKELPLNVEILNTQLHCSTKEIFQKYAQSFYCASQCEKTLKESWLTFSNAEILQKSSLEVNDLLAPLLQLYPQLLAQNVLNGAFLSGSGGCFWKLKEKV